MCGPGIRSGKGCEYPDCPSDGAWQCDYPLAISSPTTGSSMESETTCDRYVCLRHSKRVASNTDYCWEHFQDGSGRLLA